MVNILFGPIQETHVIGEQYYPGADGFGMEISEEACFSLMKPSGLN